MKLAFKTRIVLCVLTSVLVGGSVTNAQTRDTLRRRGSKKLVSGEIKKVSPDFISIEIGGSVQNIPVDQVEQYIFSDDPLKLKSVRSAVKTGQLEQAKADLEKVKIGGRDFVKQEVLFFRAIIDAKLALQGKADVASATRQLGGFLKSNPNSFRYYEGCETMGHLAQSLDRFDMTTRYFDKLTESKSPGLAARGALLLGDAHLSQGDAQKANAMFSQCAKSSDERLKTMGNIGKAACLAKNAGNAKQAISVLEKIIDEQDSGDVNLFARAYNALGQAYLSQGNTESALDAYLHTDLLFYRNSEKHAEALFHLTKLWTEVNKPVEASKAKSKLKQAYPRSVWAKK